MSPINPDLADIFGDADLDFVFFCFDFLFPRFPDRALAVGQAGPGGFPGRITPPVGDYLGESPLCFYLGDQMVLQILRC